MSLEGIQYPEDLDRDFDLPDTSEEEALDEEGGISSCCGARVRKGFCTDCKEGVC